MLDDAGLSAAEPIRRYRPLVKLQYVFNVGQTEGLDLRSLQTAAAAWEGHERAQALMRASGVRIDHVAGDREYYRLSQERVVPLERRQFASQDASINQRRRRNTAYSL